MVPIEIMVYHGVTESGLVVLPKGLPHNAVLNFLQEHPKNRFSLTFHVGQQQTVCRLERVNSVGMLDNVQNVLPLLFLQQFG